MFLNQYNYVANFIKNREICFIMSRSCNQDKEVSDINVFHFGNSVSDPGNTLYEQQPGPQVATNTDIQLAPPAEFNLRYYANGAPGAEHSYAFYAAKELGMNYLKGSQIQTLGCLKNNYINFALSGASQTGNIVVALNSYTPPPPTANFLSYQWEVNTFETLLNNNPSVTVTDKDIFIYECFGENELFTFLLTNPSDITTYTTQEVQACINNFTALYNRGMRRLFFTVFDFDGSAQPLGTDLSIFPGFVQLSGNNAPNAALSSFDAVLDFMLHNPTYGMLPVLQNAIDANTWPGLEIVVVSMASYYGDLKARQPLNGISAPVTGTYSPYDFNTTVGQGKWPANVSSPLSPSYQYFFTDSIHMTEHTQKLASEYLKSWIAPLPTRPAPRCEKKKCCCDKFKPRTPTVTVLAPTVRPSITVRKLD
jgi:hypothetical protein